MTNVPKSPIVEEDKYPTPAMLAWMNALSGLGMSYPGRVTGATGVAALIPTGWTVSRTGAGSYTITHNLATTSYAVSVELLFIGGTAIKAGVAAIDANTFSVATYSAAGALADFDFCFTLTTP